MHLCFCFHWTLLISAHLCCRFTVTTGYFGLSFSTAQLHANPYISCFISAAIEVPGNISSWLALLYFPRRHSVIGVLLLAAAPLFLVQLVPQSKQKKRVEIMHAQAHLFIPALIFIQSNWHGKTLALIHAWNHHHHENALPDHVFCETWQLGVTLGETDDTEAQRLVSLLWGILSQHVLTELVSNEEWHVNW